MTNEQPATIGERAAMEYFNAPLSRLRHPEQKYQKHEAEHAARIDALVAEHTAAKDAEIKRLREALMRIANEHGFTPYIGAGKSKNEIGKIAEAALKGTP